jgi:Na+:H+ antiporter, NhaA family
MAKLTKLFIEFIESERAGGIVLLICTIVSLTLANSFIQVGYIDFWHYKIASMQIDHWINDGLMAIFFLLIGLELEREIYIGELSDLRNALFPIFAAVGGMLVPAGLHLIFNFGTITQAGAGIPMATDIAFALGILSLLGKRVPTSLKIFLTALAVIDDLGAIITIAVLYTKTLSFINLGIALAIYTGLIALNRLKVYNLTSYLIGGIVMWYFILHSGIHPTITGVLLAFAIPFKGKKEKSPSSIIQHILHKPVAFIILPLFALANTCISIESDLINNLYSSNSFGIFLGLLLGKPIGIILISFLAVTIGFCSLPNDLKWRQIVGIGFLGGIGFTMSIFITLLAFEDQSLIATSKITVLITSTLAGIIGFIILNITLKQRRLSEEN